jgi:hypothetical protein
MTQVSHGASDATPTREDAVHALGSLTSAERILYGRLMVRQLNQPGTARLLKRYGPAGVVQIVSARAMNVSLVLLVVVAVVFAAAGQGVVAGTLFAVGSLLLVAVCVRSASAARLGRRWRAR